MADESDHAPRSPPAEADANIPTMLVLYREVALIRERTDLQIASLKEFVTDKMENAEVSRDSIKREIEHVQAFLNERIVGAARERQAALTFAKEATEKTEQRFERQIGQMGDLFSSKIDNLTKRLDEDVLHGATREGKGVGVGMTVGAVVQTITTIVAILTAVGILVHFAKQ